jgi:hypothetical protein
MYLSYVLLIMRGYIEVPPWSPERNACVVYVCGSIEKFSGLGEKALQQGE